jgi:hypothetical protein
MANLLTPNNLFALEQQVLTDLQDFQKKAAIYRRCEGNDNIHNKDTYNIPNNKVCSDSDKNISFGVIQAAYNKLLSPTEPKGSLTLLNEAIAVYKTANPASSSQNTLYDTTYKKIMTQYNEIGKLRQSLDAKLSELYEVGDTRSNFYQRKLMSDSYTKIILTILATTLTIAAFASMQRR